MRGRSTSAGTTRCSSWSIRNRRSRTAGTAPGYQVLPGHGALSILTDDDGPQARGAFSAHRVWLTAYKPRERFPDGDSPMPGSAQGLPAYAADGDAVEDTDVVLWVTVGFNHLTRAEDWPILSTRWHGFAIRPFNFFARNPAAAGDEHGNAADR